MKFIGENIHVISKKNKAAFENRDKDFILDMAKRQMNAGVDWIDLNIGPARRGLDGIMEWLSFSIQELGAVNFSFDTTNATEMEAGLKSVKNPQDCIINSTNGDMERLEKVGGLAAKYGSYLIALTMTSETGIPKDPDGRLEIAFQIVETANAMGIDNSKLIIDPLVLPISVDQSQAMEALTSIRVFKETFDPPVLTTIGLSNVSNGSPKENRDLINRVFAVMAAGCGLDTAIVDAFDSELIRVNKVLESQIPQKNYDKLYLDIYKMMQDFGDIEGISYNKACKEETAVYKTLEILMNKNVYSHNYLDI